ncbi:MAG: sigma-70 family RNA polymerase sigma factor [Acidobacteriota bacterium]
MTHLSVNSLTLDKKQGEQAQNGEDTYALVERIRAGDREAFKSLACLYQKQVFLLAYSFFKNREDASDIVQETFLRCYQKIHLFDRSKNFQNWILQITKNLCIDWYRRQHSRENRMTGEKSVEELNLSSKTSDRFDRASDLQTILTEGIKTLSDKQRLVFVMKHFNNLKYTEISEILNIAVGTVKSLHFKAVQNLRTTLSPHMGRTA